MSEHLARVDYFGGKHYGFCPRFDCRWTGPFRRFQWLARRDARRHVSPVTARADRDRAR